MSHYWNCNPELYTEIIFKEMVRRELCNEEDDLNETVKNFINDPRFCEVAIEAERDYWADRVDKAKEASHEGGDCSER